MQVDDSSLEVSPRPTVDAARAATIARELYGVDGPVVELGSQQDRNFRIDTGAGRVVLKVANPGWGSAALEAQNAALVHLATQHPDLVAPVPLPGLDGRLLHEVPDGAGTVLVRLLTYVEGTPLTGARRLAPQVVADLGRLSARVCSALTAFDHAGLDRAGQWDLRRADAVVAQLLGSVGDPVRRAVVADAVALASARLAESAERLRVGPIHADLTDDNVVGSRDEAGRVRPDAVIDFGDLSRSWLVGDLAVTCSSVLRYSGHGLTDVLPAVRAFHEVIPLTDDEVAALWPLVVLRGAVLVVSTEHQLALDPENADLAEPLEGEWRILDSARAVDLDLAEALLRAGLGLPGGKRHDAAREVACSATSLLATRLREDAVSPQAEATPGTAVVDLSVTSRLLHSGRFLEPEVEHEILREAARPGGSAATRWGEARLTRTELDSIVAPDSIALGTQVIAQEGTRVVSPFAGVVSREADSGFRLVHETGLRLVVSGVAVSDDVVDGEHVQAGSPIGAFTAETAHLQWCVSPQLETPAFAPPSTAAGWLALCPDPSPLLGVDVAAPRRDPADLLRRRRRALASVQESYYEQPMRIERGWRHHLVDIEGRAYVDMVNNVAAIGHGHPRLADAVEQQLRTLNTNSRFHYAAIAQFSERLAALAPEGLDQVFLVNSGSEAVDLALRMAQTVTRRQDVVAVREAYHGWTALSDAVTTSLYDNPSALESRPEWVHLASAPNAYRGRFRGESAGADYAAEVRELVEGLVERGRPPAAYVCEPLLGNAGGVLLPDGYLAAAYDAVRAAGGLAVADEVQVGYGRTGRWWWAFERSGVVPDVITVAKAMGNGHPLGAVITTREIAGAFEAAGSFFSSAGGSPVSCVTGMTVLDVIEDEGLQASAVVVGDHLVEGLTALMARHPLVGAVHGTGLYLGVELVRDRKTLEPASAECAAICERLRELGVIMQPTGERANVLKLKPPMCLTLDSADVVLAALDSVLTDGW